MDWKCFLPAILLAASCSAMAAENQPAVLLDFEGNNAEYVVDNPYEGNKCYKFAGIGKYAYRKLPLKLQGGVTYRISMGIRKDICTPAEAKKMDFTIGAYLPGSKKFTLYTSGGANVLGEDKWTAFSKTHQCFCGLFYSWQREWF